MSGGTGEATSAPGSNVHSHLRPPVVLGQLAMDVGISKVTDHPEFHCEPHQRVSFDPQWQGWPLDSCPSPYSTECCQRSHTVNE